MKTNAELDKWAAEKCGVEVTTVNNSLFINPWKAGRTLPTFRGSWTLSDARCREMVREHFGVKTMSAVDPTSDEWVFWCMDSVRSEVFNDYSSIAEAEIACIQAIADASASSDDSKDAEDEV